jgi:hypothetical protein
MSAAEPATAAATSEDVTTAADVGIGTTTGVKAVATTAAALRKCSKVKEGSLPPEHHFLSRNEIHLSDKLL